MVVLLLLRCARDIGFDRLYPLSEHWIVFPDASCSISIEPVTSVSAVAGFGPPCARCIAKTADSARFTHRRCVMKQVR